MKFEWKNSDVAGGKENINKKINQNKVKEHQYFLEHWRTPKDKLFFYLILNCFCLLLIRQFSIYCRPRDVWSEKHYQVLPTNRHGFDSRQEERRKTFAGFERRKLFAQQDGNGIDDSGEEHGGEEAEVGRWDWGRGFTEQKQPDPW